MANQEVQLDISNMTPRPNEKVDVTIRQTNTGNESLSNIWCWLGLTTLTGVSIPGYAFGKDQGLYLGPGETRIWQASGIKVEEPMAFVAKVHGYINGVDITYPDYPDARERVDVYTYGEPIEESGFSWSTILGVGAVGLVIVGGVLLTRK